MVSRASACLIQRKLNSCYWYEDGCETHKQAELALADETAGHILVRRSQLPALLRVCAHRLHPANPGHRVLLRGRQRPCPLILIRSTTHRRHGAHYVHTAAPPPSARCMVESVGCLPCVAPRQRHRVTIAACSSPTPAISPVPYFILSEWEVYNHFRYFSALQAPGYLH